MNTVPHSSKLLLIAVDGVSFSLLERWGAQGDLPTLKKLMEGGCCGLCVPFSPSNSAVIWTSVMTGMNPEKHGIDSFIYYRMGERLIKKTVVKKVLKLGLRPLFRWLKSREYIRDIPFSLSSVQQKMLWEIFAQEGRSVGIINWWHSWPACEVPGFMISDRVHYWRLTERGKHAGTPDAHLTYPDSLLDEVLKRVADPLALPFEVYAQFMKVSEREVEEKKNSHYQRHQLMSEFKYLYSIDESVRRLALFCLKEFFQPDFLTLYFRGIDIISHCALKYMPENRDSQITDREIEQFGDTVHRYYCYMDSVIEELINTVSTDTTIMLVSDHGFEREPDGRFGHRKTKPPGLLMLQGNSIKQKLRIENVSLYDVAPTLLYLGGLPVSKAMDGRILTECIEEAFLPTHPPGFIESYGTPLRRYEAGVRESEEEIKERLRALGYID